MCNIDSFGDNPINITTHQYFCLLFLCKQGFLSLFSWYILLFWPILYIYTVQFIVK